MELIMMCILTIVALTWGIYIGKSWGKESGYNMGWYEGYDKGIEDTSESLNEIEDFPKTLDGKFFSTDAAMRNISNKDGDK